MIIAFLSITMIDCLSMQVTCIELNLSSCTTAHYVSGIVERDTREPVRSFFRGQEYDTRNPLSLLPVCTAQYSFSYILHELRFYFVAQYYINITW